MPSLPFHHSHSRKFAVQDLLVSASICLSESFEPHSNMNSAHQPQRSRSMECRPTQSSESCSFLQLIMHTENRLSIAPSRSSEPGTEASPISSNLELTNNFHTPPTSFLRLTPDAKDSPWTTDLTELEPETLDSSETSFLKLTSPRGGSTSSDRKVMVKTISETRHFSAIERLPIELQLMTLERLPIIETRNIRLASRSWAAAGVEHLFRRHFMVRPNQGMSRINYLDDLSKLEAVSQDPHISKDLILIEFASSDMPMPHFLLFLLDQKQSMTREQWSRTVSGIDIPLQGACERSILEKIFQYLPRLDQIFVRSLVRPTRYADYNLPTLGSWVDNYHRSRRQLVNFLFCCERRRCTAILLAANKLQLPLYSLHVEYFPIECFWSSEAPSSSNTAPERKLPYDSLKGDDITRKTMSKARYLSLGLAFNRNVSTNSFTYDLMFLSRELGHWLACFEGLRSLELGLSIQETCWHNQFMAQFSEALSRITFPQLVKLNFKRLLLIPQDMQPFILNHSSTIRYLGIDGGYFVPGGGGGNDTREFLTTIRDKMKKLERFSFVPNHDDRLLIYHNWDWDRLPEDNTKPIKVTHLIEYYVLGKCPWPMVPEGRDCLWRPKFLGTHEKFLAMSREEKEDYFEKRWEWVVGADSIDLDGDLEIGSDDDEEVDVDMERDSDLASLNQLLQAQHCRSDL